MLIGEERRKRPEPAVWKRRWVSWRNRVLAARKFQRRASALPLVRLVARRRAVDLFDLVAGFSYSQVLLASVETGLLDLLAEGYRDEAAVSRATGLSVDAASRLLRAATALDLAEEIAPGWWMLGQRGAALQANPGVLAMVRHHRLLYTDLADPVALLRADRREATALSRYWSYASDGAGADGAEQVAGEYSRLMAASHAMVAEQALDAYPFGRHRAVLDIGGGHGAFAMALARAHEGIRIGIFDLPTVLAETRAQIEPPDLQERITLYPGNFLQDDLPQGFDCITLVRILHDHDDGPCLDLLRKIRVALAPGGRLVVVEPMADTRGAAAMGDAYFGFYLWAMGSGRPRSARELGQLLKRAGFAQSRTRQTRQPVVTSMVVANR